MNNMIKRLAALFFAMAMILTACGGEKTGGESKGSAEGGQGTIYATTLSAYDFTDRIAGDRYQVVHLMEGVTDTHHWEPSPDDLVKLDEAKMLVINGAGYELWLESVIDNLDKAVVLVDSSQGIDLLSATGGHDHGEEEEEHDDHGHNHGAFDPHYWTSPKVASKQAENIYKALVEMDPEGKEVYEKNFEALKEDLKKLDEEYQSKLKGYEGRAIVVPHLAYSYLADEFGLEQIAIEGLLADGDPNPQRMAEIVELAKKQTIKLVFYDAYGTDKTAAQIAAELGTETAPLYTLESVSKEDMDKGEDYFSLMRKNLESILKAFGE